jgi:hypothetical protein
MAEASGIEDVKVDTETGEVTKAYKPKPVEINLNYRDKMYKQGTKTQIGEWLAGNVEIEAEQCKKFAIACGFTVTGTADVEGVVHKLQGLKRTSPRSKSTEATKDAK